MVRLSAAIQSNDRESGIKTVLTARFLGLKKIIWLLFFDNAALETVTKVSGVSKVNPLLVFEPSPKNYLACQSQSETERRDFQCAEKLLPS